ncbi:putative SOS-response repressor and protease LexA [Vibrio phage 137E35-1]|nr:putative SOS-response repressor and protease LexA [Vibrio phage 137E35-1]CAH9016664.1 putative SOS-response repressor and protease LexA [Vibrio phage 230E39-1]
MSFNYKRFNLNNAVKVKLNEIGHLEMERQHNELYKTIGIKHRPFTRKAADENGYSTFQMHTLMNTFGHMLTLGSKPPFESLDLLIADLLLKDAKPSEASKPE